MSIFKIKKTNKEFAKWWDCWAARLQRNRVFTGSREVPVKKDQEVTGLPYVVEILRRFPYKSDL